MDRRGAVTILLLVPLLLPAGCSTQRQEPRRAHDWRAVAPVPPEQKEGPGLSPAPSSTPSENPSPPGAKTDGQPPVGTLAPGHSQASPPSPQVNWPDDAPRGSTGLMVRAGRELADATPSRIKGGGSALSCSSCHLQGGTRDGYLSWLGAATAYPRYVPRAGRSFSLADQVNACMERALNAPSLALESQEMQAILAYLRFLGRYPARLGQPVEPPARAADLQAGEAGYRRACLECHGANGGGLKTQPANGRVPPLWGAASYGTGCGLHRVLSAAAFIRDHMPPETESGRLSLESGEAYDIAAYVNSFGRPEPPGLENDYPALSEKPADCPYPPYPDSFPPEQHKFGPFPPIIAEEAAAMAADWRRFHWDSASLPAAEASPVAAGRR